MGSIPERLITGIPRIDKEHQLLVELVDWIEDICTVANARDCLGCILAMRDRCGGSLDTLLTSLKTYMREHFRYEERLMDSTVPWDHMDEHQADHRRIEKRLLDLIDAYAQGRNTAAVSRQVVGELRVWIVDHIDTYDSVLAVHIGSEDRK